MATKAWHEKMHNGKKLEVKKLDKSFAEIDRMTGFNPVKSCHPVKRVFLDNL